MGCGSSTVYRDAETGTYYLDVIHENFKYSKMRSWLVSTLAKLDKLEANAVAEKAARKGGK